jgi:protein-disulfide isomerase
MEAKRTRATTADSKKQQQTFVIVTFIVIAAVAVGLIAVLISSQNVPVAQAGFYDGIPQERLPDGGFVLGDPEAPVTIVEFADFACPHCQTYAPTMKQLIDEYVRTGMARFEYRMFPTAADPTYGPYTARLAECAHTISPGTFWEAHDVLFELGSRGRFNDTTSRALGERLGIAHNELVACAGDAEQVDLDGRMGERLGVQSTPSIMARIGNSEPQFISVGGRTFNRGPVPYEVLEAVITSNQ